MRRILDIVYTLATLLIIIGALLIFQDDAKGLVILSVGIFCNIMYRLFTLNWSSIMHFQWFELIRGLNIFFMLFALLGFFFEWEGKINYLIVAIILDVLLNLKDISFGKTKQ